MPPNRNGAWQGGRIHVDVDGRPHFTIEKQRRGRRYSIALNVASEREAMAELALFERDPAAFEATLRTKVAPVPDEGLFLNEELLQSFLDYAKAKNLSLQYRRDLKSYLVNWGEALHDQDLRKLELQTLKRTLVSRWKGARKHRIIALKSFFAWLREEAGLVSHQQDATLSLRVPPSRPEKALRPKGYSMETVERVYRAVVHQDIRDCLVLHCKTGMHQSEIERLAAGGNQGVLDELPPWNCSIAGVARFVHKSGDPHNVSLDAQAVAAAKRLRAAGRAPARSWISQHLRDIAVHNKGVEHIRMGELRHSWITWCRARGKLVHPPESGVPLAQVAAIAGHHSIITTRRYYDGTAVEPMIELPLKLVHQDDPAPLVARSAAERKA